jgi:hypothetical protein
MPVIKRLLFGAERLIRGHAIQCFLPSMVGMASDCRGVFHCS